jgi:sugar phosphate isomerase/epimerase
MSKRMNRRRFLKMAGLGGAASVLAPASMAHATRKKPWQMRLSTSSIHFMELPIEQACEKIAKLGFTGIDIWSAHENCPHLDDVAQRLGGKGLKELLYKHQLDLFAFSVYQGGYARYAELLGQAGGGVAIQGSAPPCQPSELRARMREFLEKLKPLAELAERHNSYLALENHGNALLNTLDSLKAFVDLNRSPRLGLALAPYHIQLQQASVPEAIRICGQQLFFFYAWQHEKGVKQLPGVGPTDMIPWIQALQAIRYRGHVNPFAHSHPGTELMSASLKTARQYLLDCYKKIT